VQADLTPRLQVVRPGAQATEVLVHDRTATLPAQVVEAEAPPSLGPYEVIGLLATGGMGGVYVGRHTLTLERVALKVLAPRMAMQDDLVRRLFGELDVSRKVRHHGLVTIRDRGISSGAVPYLVMDLIDGENLADLLDRGRIEIGAVAAIGAQVSDALAAMHERRIIHCDLKPDNVVVMYHHGLAGWPQIKVVDFGVARFLDRVADPTVAGTPAYMPPEQWAGEVEPRTDVYALGCMLYELLLGAPPFNGTIVEMMAAHSDTLPALPSLRRANVPAALEDLILRMLAKDPGMRPRMVEVARALTDLAFEMPPGARVLEMITLAS